MSAAIAPREFRLWSSELDPGLGLWTLADNALGAAWVVRGGVDPLVTVMANVLAHDRFRGTYVQLIGLGGDETLVTVKGYVPTRAPTFLEAARGFVRRDSRSAIDRFATWDETSAALHRVCDGLEIVFRGEALPFGRVRDPKTFEGSLRGLLGTDAAGAEVVGREDGLTVGGARRQVVSFLRRRELVVEQLGDALERAREAACGWQLSVVPDAEGRGTAHGFAVADADFSLLEQVFGDDRLPGRFLVVREGPLALPALLWMSPFGPEPRLATQLEAPAAAVRLAEDLHVDAA